MPVSASRSTEGVFAGTPARYFPVDRRPLHMRPRLRPFPTDLGNGARDALYFQRDAQAPRYLAAKRPDRYRIARGQREDAAHGAVLDWMTAVLREERHAELEADEPDAAYAAIAAAVQEDFTVQLRDPDGSDRAIGVWVSFPSGWRPEGILGWSFRRIHAPVPEFADGDAPARSLVDAMVERGPYLRFVWTLCADDVLDHHPEEGGRRHFDGETDGGWLRIERQITVPFPAVQASLFLIRTYLRPFSQLDPGERDTLAAALGAMPSSTARYKGLETDLPHAIALLRA